MRDIAQDRPWNDPGPRRGQVNEEAEDTRPLLRAVILDFSPVSFMDTTSAQALVDLQRQFARHATPDSVAWYFVNVNDRWTKRAIVASGFGTSSPLGGGDDSDPSLNVTLNIAAAADGRVRSAESGEWRGLRGAEDVESGSSEEVAPVAVEKAGETVDWGESLYGVNRPYFHVLMETAVKSAVALARKKDMSTE